MTEGQSGADPERLRLAEDGARQAYWKRWGPYLPERQRGTVREDRAYRWGEDGLLGWCDRQCRLCFA